MPVLGVTGSIATGKSVAVSLLRESTGAEAFDADLCVRRLLEESEPVKSAVEETFGGSVIGEAGLIDRASLREVVFRNPMARQKLESILHPRVREEWQNLIHEKNASSSGNWLILEIPLLFETRAEAKMDRIIVTACSRETQRSRLANRTGLSWGIAQNIVATQLPQLEKIQACDYLIWTDCPVERTAQQVQTVSNYLKALYG